MWPTTDFGGATAPSLLNIKDKQRMMMGPLINMAEGVVFIVVK